MTHRRTISAIIVAAALLSGCSVHYWRKPGATPEDVRTDYTGCADDARIAGPLVRPIRLASCMTERGYKIDDSGCRGEIAGIPVQCPPQHSPAGVSAPMEKRP